MNKVDSLAKKIHSIGCEAWNKVSPFEMRPWERQAPYAVLAYVAIAKWHLREMARRRTAVAKPASPNTRSRKAVKRSKGRTATNSGAQPPQADKKPLWLPPLEEVTRAVIAECERDGVNRRGEIAMAYEYIERKLRAGA